MNHLVGTVFHESFPLDVHRLAKILIGLAEYEPVGNSRNSGVQAFLKDNAQGLGNNMIKAFPRYAKACGMIDKNFLLTELGTLCANDASLLTSLHTMWLMHYNLSAPNGPGPQFWSDLVAEYFRPGNRFTTDQINQSIVDSTLRATRKRVEPEKTTNAFMKTYLNDEGLGRLGILQDLGNNEFEVSYPGAPDIWVLAYAFVKYWQSVYGDIVTVNINDLGARGGFSEIFLVGPYEVAAMLDAMQQEQWATTYRTAHPHQVVILQKETTPILKKIYG